MEPRTIYLAPDAPKAQSAEFMSAPGAIHATGPNAETAEFEVDGKTHEFALNFTRPIPRFDVSNATLRYRAGDDLSGRNIAFNGSVHNPEDRPYGRHHFEAILSNGMVMEGELDKDWNQARTVYGIGEWRDNVGED